MTDCESTISVSASAMLPMGRLSASGRVISSFAYQHFRAAVVFRNRTVELERQNLNAPFGPFFEDITSYCSGCVMSGAAALEAFINLIFFSPVDPLRAELGNFDNAYWGKGGIERLPPLEKYQFALTTLKKVPFDANSQPYQSALALMELRNALVHYKPTWDPDRQRIVDLKAKLLRMYPLSPFTDSGADLITMRSMSEGCAKWVVDTIVLFLTDFHTRSGIDSHKQFDLWLAADRP